MNMEDVLREALQGGAAELQPVGPGPDHARNRAFRRKRRFQSGVVALGAIVLVGGTIAVIETRPSGTTPRVTAEPATTTGASTPDLAWKSVAGTVLFSQHQFTTADGVTYAISTAPGSKGSNTVEPQELYSTRDGVKWTSTSLGAAPWVADLAESKGVLYALGTGPGQQPGSTDYKLSTSDDGGAKWDDAPIPVSFTPPAANVPLQPSTSVHIARGAHTTVVIATAAYWPDFSKVLGKEAVTLTTLTGVEVVDINGCKQLRKVVVTAPDPAGVAAGKCARKVVATHPWSDFGISDPAALHQEKAIVRDDGGSWQTIDLPSVTDGSVLDVAATSSGFLLAESKAKPGGPGSVQISTSTDGRSWAPLAGPVPAFDTASISGGRIIGVDNQASKLYVSNDAGATWIALSDVAGLLPGNDPVEAFSTDVAAGPLGYAAVVRTGGGVNAAGKPDGSGSGSPNTLAPPSREEVLQHTYLLHSSDGVSWKVTSLADVGAPADGSVSNVNVGADHIDVSFQSPQTGSDGSASATKLTTLVATPQA